MKSEETINKAIINKIIIVGWLCLITSSTFFYISTRTISINDQDSEITFALLMMVARFFGLGAFTSATVCMFNKRWTNGTILFLGSIGLPFLSLIINGTI